MTGLEGSKSVGLLPWNAALDDMGTLWLEDSLSRKLYPTLQLLKCNGS